MYILITARPDEDDVDRDSATGLTEDAYSGVVTFLISHGFDDIDIQPHPVDE